VPYKDYSKQLQNAKDRYKRIKADPILLDTFRKQRRDRKRQRYKEDVDFREKECRGARAWYHNNKSKSLNTKRRSELKYKAQPGICEICKKYKEKLYRDHCHASGYWRGFICHNCNTILGHAKDSIDILREAINYLERFQKGIRTNSSGQLDPSVDGLLANLGATSEFHIVQRNGGTRGSVRPSMLDRSRRAYNVSIDQSASDSTQRGGKINGSPGHSDSEFDNSSPRWTSQADGVGWENDPPSSPSRFNDETTCNDCCE
jgi:Recombination endonuclease VII